VFLLAFVLVLLVLVLVVVVVLLLLLFFVFCCCCCYRACSYRAMATEQEEEPQTVVDWYGSLFNGNGGNSATELLLDRSESETSHSSESDADEVPVQEPKGSADDASVHPVDDVPGDVELPGLELEDLDRFITGEEEATVVIPDQPWKKGDVLHRQTLIMLHNMSAKLSSLSLKQRKDLRSWLGAPTANKHDLTSTLVAHLIGSSASTVANVVNEVKSGTRQILSERSAGVPRKPAAATVPKSGTGGATALTKAEQKEDDLVACSRIALRSICLGRPATEYTGDVRVVQLAGGAVGLTHHSKKILAVCNISHPNW
jgi:hypothetical protein